MHLLSHNTTKYVITRFDVFTEEICVVIISSLQGLQGQRGLYGPPGPRGNRVSICHVPIPCNQL